MGVPLDTIKSESLRERIRKVLNEDRRLSSNPQPQPLVRHEPLAKVAREESHSSRFRVCVNAYRQRLTDPDNLSPKYFIDCLRYSQIIPDDTQADIELVVRQEKVRYRVEERTELEVVPIP